MKYALISVRWMAWVVAIGVVVSSIPSLPAGATNNPRGEFPEGECGQTCGRPEPRAPKSYAPPTEGEGSGKPRQTWGSGTRELAKTLEDDRGSGR